MAYQQLTIEERTMIYAFCKAEYSLRQIADESRRDKTTISRGNKIMPHVIVKLYPGRSEEVKKRLADKIAGDIMSIAGCDEKSVSIAIEEITPDKWADKVYKPDIIEKETTLYKKPGYNPVI